MRYTVSLVSWHTPKRIHRAVFVPSQVVFVSTSRCATDGCANSLYYFITKRVCHRRVCQLSFFFLSTSRCATQVIATTQYFFHLNATAFFKVLVLQKNASQFWLHFITNTFSLALSLRFFLRDCRTLKLKEIHFLERIFLNYSVLPRV